MAATSLWPHDSGHTTMTVLSDCYDCDCQVQYGRYNAMVTLGRLRYDGYITTVISQHNSGCTTMDTLERLHYDGYVHYDITTDM